MYKMIIIDDDPLILKSMQKHINWEEIGIEIIDTATTGTEGLSKIVELMPQIVITDISMPDMTGLEMIDQLNKLKITAKMVLLTGYDDFKYAKSAISLGVCEYITKPAMPDDIKSIMREVVRQCDIEFLETQEIESARKQVEENFPILREKFLEELVEGRIVSHTDFKQKCEFLQLDFVDKNYLCFIVNLNDFANSDELGGYIVKQTIISMITTQIRKNDYNCHNINFKNRRCILILSYEKTADTEEITHFLTNLCESLIKNYKNSHSMNISVGVGDFADNYSKIRNSYNQAVECLKFLFSENTGKILFYNDIVNTQIINSIELYNRDELIDGLKMRNILVVEKNILDMIDNINASKGLNAEYIKTIVLEMLSAVSYTIYNIGDCSAEEMARNNVEWEKISNSQNISDIICVLHEILKYIKNTLGIKNNQRSSRIAEQMIIYIHENFTQNISLKTLSQCIYLTPNYLGNIFQNEMGTTFKNYLVNYRMKQAKEMLLSGKYNVNEVSENVGYKNLDYFRKTFKSCIGTNPSDFVTK